MFNIPSELTRFAFHSTALSFAAVLGLEANRQVSPELKRLLKNAYLLAPLQITGLRSTAYYIHKCADGEVSAFIPAIVAALSYLATKWFIEAFIKAWRQFQDEKKKNE